MKSIGRYTLIVEDNEKKNFVPFSTNNNIKVDLATIDRYTTKFLTPQQLVEDLKNKDIIVNGYRTMYISYRSNKAEQKLEVAFSEHEQLSKIAQKSASKVNIDSPEFNKFLNTFLKLIDNNNFYEFLLNQKINDMSIVSAESRLKGHFDERYSVGRDDDFTISKTKEHISSYKKFRDIYLVVCEYNEIFKRLFTFLANPSFCQTLLSSKDISPQIKKYINDYLNSSADYLLSEIKKQLSYSELLKVEHFIDIFPKKEQVYEEKIEEELLEVENLKEKYPEAYVEHKMNPYSSYEEEKEYEQYMDSLIDEGFKRINETESKPKVKVLRKKQVNSRQLTLFDQFEK